MFDRTLLGLDDGRDAALPMSEIPPGDIITLGRVALRRDPLKSSCDGLFFDSHENTDSSGPWLSLVAECLVGVSRFWSEDGLREGD